MKKAPCFNCVDRGLGCHAICQNYIEWTEQREEEKAADRRRRDVDRALNAIKEEGLRLGKKGEQK